MEGPSDILYLQALSAALRSQGKSGLDPRWTLCPSGGIDKVQPFMSLFAGNADKLDVAVLTDQGLGNRNKVKKLKRSDLLKAGRVYSIADFIGTSEGDIEDLFSVEIYVEILNSSYDLRDSNIITVKTLTNADPKLRFSDIDETMIARFKNFLLD